jgi:predicted MPP superfamily phosphohydrolase
MIILALPTLDLVWWRWADARLRPLRRAGMWRIALAGFMFAQILAYAGFVGSRLLDLPLPLPAAALTLLYLWHMLVLPATMSVLMIGSIGRDLLKVARRLSQWWQGKAITPTQPNNPPAPGPTRRQVLAAAAVAVPPLLAVGAMPRALSQLRGFRVRRMDVLLPTLSPALDGLTIAHVSDVHVGKFTNGAILRAVADQTNALKADLVMVTGDLIDFALADLPAGLDMLRRINPRSGLFMCEGNHDLFDDRAEFERQVKASGVPLLLNESATIKVRGEDIQVLGLKWGWSPRDSHGGVEANLNELLPLRQPGVFQILLAHHPHAFDTAEAAGIPLTLAGHTHGGQLMLGPNAGIGPLMFKYWSGLYRRSASSLVVSNGVGNWFPLRINAPAEIIHLTLRRSARVISGPRR